MQKRSSLLVPVLVVGLWLAAFATSTANDALFDAAQSITAEKLREHVDVLSDDSFEGREAGSRGGRAAAGYLVKRFQQAGSEPAGEGGSYFQTFGQGYRNILGLLEGRDPKLKSEIILVGAHYDHVGYGNRSNSYGPTGYIHNGADDNASGAAGVLEVMQAFSRLPARPRRSILFVLWDGEEKGLLGSKHWVSRSTIPMARLKFAINMDMIGRLRPQGLEVYGTRTSFGLRRLVSENSQGIGVPLKFTWEMKDNSDHHTFFRRSVPVLMLHTGLHDDYHRPSDDAHKVNSAGMEAVGKMLFQISHDLAERPVLHGFRTTSRRETPSDQKRFETPARPGPPRLGIWMRDPQDGESGVGVTRLQSGSAAQQAGMQIGDRIISFAGTPVTNQADLVGWILQAREPVTMTVQRAGEEQPLPLLVTLAGSPVRIGISWRMDDADPSMAMITKVVSGSPGHRAGLRPRDRIYAVGGQSFTTSLELLQLFKADSPIEVTTERRGKVQTVSLAIPPLPSE